MSFALSCKLVGNISCEKSTYGTFWHVKDLSLSSMVHIMEFALAFPKSSLVTSTFEANLFIDSTERIDAMLAALGHVLDCTALEVLKLNAEDPLEYPSSLRTSLLEPFANLGSLSLTDVALSPKAAFPASLRHLNLSHCVIEDVRAFVRAGVLGGVGGVCGVGVSGVGGGLYLAPMQPPCFPRAPPTGSNLTHLELSCEVFDPEAEAEADTDTDDEAEANVNLDMQPCMQPRMQSCMESLVKLTLSGTHGVLDEMALSSTLQTLHLELFDVASQAEVLEALSTKAPNLLELHLSHYVPASALSQLTRLETLSMPGPSKPRGLDFALPPSLTRLELRPTALPRTRRAPSTNPKIPTIVNLQGSLGQLPKSIQSLTLHNCDFDHACIDNLPNLCHAVVVHNHKTVWTYP